MAKAIDLDGMTLAELNALIEAAEAKRQEKAEQEKAAFIAETRERAAKLGLSFDTLFLGRPGPRKLLKGGAGTVPVKYRGPAGQEWSGRGRLPNWLSALEAQGRKREEFRV